MVGYRSESLYSLANQNSFRYILPQRNYRQSIDRVLTKLFIYIAQPGVFVYFLKIRFKSNFPGNAAVLNTLTQRLYFSWYYKIGYFPNIFLLLPWIIHNIQLIYFVFIRYNVYFKIKNREQIARKQRIRTKLQNRFFIFIENHCNGPRC